MMRKGSRGDDRLRPSQSNQGVGLSQLDPGGRHVVGERAPADQQMLNGGRSRFHREASEDQGRAAPAELLHRQAGHQGRRPQDGGRSTAASGHGRQEGHLGAEAKPTGRISHGVQHRPVALPAVPLQIHPARLRGALPRRAPPQMVQWLLPLPMVNTFSRKWSAWLKHQELSSMFQHPWCFSH